MAEDMSVESVRRGWAWRPNAEGSPDHPNLRLPRRLRCRPMSPAVLFPRFDHPAIEERYASWQSKALLTAAGVTEVVTYDVEESASVAVGKLQSDHVLVVTDPLLLPPAKLVTRLRELLVHTSLVVAALPVSNEAENPAQRRTPLAPYLT